MDQILPHGARKLTASAAIGERRPVSAKAPVAVAIARLARWLVECAEWAVATARLTTTASFQMGSCSDDLEAGGRVEVPTIVLLGGQLMAPGNLGGKVDRHNYSVPLGRRGGSIDAAKS
jgi:hypothetical protein